MNKRNKVEGITYVICPAKVKTGGTELAHQLVYMLNQIGKKACLCYIKCDQTVKITEGFEKYITTFYTINDVQDDKKNLLVIPEHYVIVHREFKDIKKAVWWMSVDNYAKDELLSFALRHYGLERFIKTLAKKLLNKKTTIPVKELNVFHYHYTQSKYAAEYLKQLGIDSMMLSDCINGIYFREEFHTIRKENIVVYNPKKGIRITKKIMKQCKEICFVPLENMTAEQIREQLKKAKVYIDFGEFPGKDRLPREAALMKCCIISGMRGASKYYEDLPISSVYKFRDPLKQMEEIGELIRKCIVEYDNRIEDFSKYVEVIKKEKEIFEKEVIDIFSGENG